MALVFQPRNTLRLKRPPIKLVVGTLSFANKNEENVAFKIQRKVEDDKKYFVSPESGRIAPGQSACVTSSVYSTLPCVTPSDSDLIFVKCEIPLKDPADRKKFSDDFIVKSIIVPSDRMSLGPPYDVWKSHAIKTRIENTITVVFEEDDLEVTPKLNTSTNTSTLPEDKIELLLAATVTAGVDAEIISGDLTSPEVPHPKFSVRLSPSYALCFQRPLTRPIWRLLTIKNGNTYAVAFEISNKTPELYSIYPNRGRVDPGQDFQVKVQSRPRKEEPPVDEDRKHRFSVKVAAVTLMHKDLSAYKILESAKENNEVTCYELEVLYIPAEGLTPEELVSYQSGAALPPPEESAKEEAEMEQLLMSGEARQQMGVRLYPGYTLRVQRPLTNPMLIPQVTTLWNTNSYPVAYKVKTTAPRLYCARPNCGLVKSGQRIVTTITPQSLKDEPPLNSDCKDRFLINVVGITTGHEDLTVDEAFENFKGKFKCDAFKLHVKYIPANAIAPETVAMNVENAAKTISKDVFSTLPPVAIYFKRPLTDTSNLTTYLTIKNIYSLPIAFRLGITSPDMYFLCPVSGIIEAGQNLNVEIIRYPVEKELPEEEECRDIICIQSTVINPGQENLKLNDVWATVENSEQQVFERDIQVLFL